MTGPRLARIAAALVVLAAAAPAAAAEPAPANDPLAVESSLLPAGPLFTPAPRPNAPECHFCSSSFTTSPGGGAPSHWGHGADCPAAQDDVRAQLSAEVNSICFSLGDYGRCAFQVVYTCSCYQQNGQWVVDAYANYRCWVAYC